MNKINKYTIYLNRYLNLSYTVGFVILVSLMLLLLGFEQVSNITIKKTELHENRAYAKFPKLLEIPLLRLPIELEDYFNDNLPFRNQIIYKYRKLMKEMLNMPSAIRGKNNQWFSGETIYNYIGKNKPDQDTLYRIRVHIVGASIFWQKNGAVYAAYFIPDNPTLYSELLPIEFSKNNSWSKQLAPFFLTLKEYGVDFVDFTSVLKSCKSDIRVCNKMYDINHWNANGKGACYSYLSQKFKTSSGFTFLDNKDSFTITEKQVELLSQFSNVQVEDIPILNVNCDSIIPVKLNNIYNKSELNYVKGVRVFTNKKVKNGSLLMISDSYINNNYNAHKGVEGIVFPLANNVKKYIATHYYSHSLISGKIQRRHHKPNIVIEGCSDLEMIDT